LLPAVAELKLIAAANAEAMLTVQLKVTLPSKSFPKGFISSLLTSSRKPEFAQAFLFINKIWVLEGNY
jgi:hypothetical protein